MARFVLVGVLAACLLLCVVQAHPTIMTPVQPTVASKIESALSDVMQSLQKGFQGLSEDPKVSQLVRDGQRALENLTATIRDGAAQIMPKTN